MDRVKLSAVVNQVSDAEVRLLDSDATDAAFKRFRDITGFRPHKDEEVTAAQLAGLHAVFASPGPPYVDFSIWGPHGDRLQKRLRFTAQQMQKDGTWKPVEVYGPPDYETWDAAFAVFRCGCLMLGKLCIGTLDRYRALIKRYNGLYPGAWLELYQADHRARLEHTEHIRRDLIEENEVRPIPGFKPRDCWDLVFRRLLLDTGFWQDELERPAMLKILWNGKSGHVTGEAPVLGAGGGVASFNASTIGAIVPYVPDAGVKRGAPGGGQPAGQPPKKMQAKDRQSNLDQGGLFRTNRRGTPLCAGYAAGTCAGGRGVCPVDGRSAHQRPRCFLPAPHDPKSCTAVPHDLSKKGKGKGRGKDGKGKGKGAQH